MEAGGRSRVHTANMLTFTGHDARACALPVALLAPMAPASEGLDCGSRDAVLIRLQEEPTHNRVFTHRSALPRTSRRARQRALGRKKFPSHISQRSKVCTASDFSGCWLAMASDRVRPRCAFGVPQIPHWLQVPLAVITVFTFGADMASRTVHHVCHLAPLRCHKEDFCGRPLAGPEFCVFWRTYVTRRPRRAAVCASRGREKARIAQASSLRLAAASGAEQEI